MPESSITVRCADPSEFDIASDFWISMRRELDMPDEDLAPDWKIRSVNYFRRRYDEGELRWFLAYDGETAVASAAGFLLDGYPSEICLNRRVGYVAGVFVKPGWLVRSHGALHPFSLSECTKCVCLCSVFLCSRDFLFTLLTRVARWL